MQEARKFGGWVARAGQVPPVYEPGGPTWIVAGSGSQADYGKLEAAAREVGVVQLIAPAGDPATLLPLGFRGISDFWRGELPGAGNAVVATDDDLALMLDLASARRAAYAEVQPVFWREAQDARDRQETWFRHLLAEPEARVLRVPRGFLIATPRGEELLVDDFMVVGPDDWLDAGHELLTSLQGPAVVICACHDAPKRRLLEELEFEPVFTWFQRSLGAAG